MLHETFSALFKSGVQAPQVLDPPGTVSEGDFLLEDKIPFDSDCSPPGLFLSTVDVEKLYLSRQ